MNKNKKILLSLSTISSVSLPLISLSCVDNKERKEKVQLLTSSQIQEIVNKFDFRLTDDGQELVKNNTLNDLWDKLTRSRDNTRNNSQLIINWNDEFKKNFAFKFHKLNGFGSSHKYNFELIFDNQTPAIKYEIICVDRNDEKEHEGIVKLEID